MEININRVLYKDMINQKVLVVDDEVAIQKLTKRFLEKFGNKVDVANNGLEGYNLYKENEYMCVISDSDMPIMTGSEMYHKIKQYDSKANFIFITGNANNLGKKIKNETIYQKPVSFNTYKEINHKIQEKLLYQ
jgi:two-component system, OmpR family, response regulator VanR